MGSLKLGYVTASLMVQKLHSYAQQNALTQALQEYGRLIRTLHVLRWYANNEDRRRILRQLNKGEALHDLRAYLMVANKGQLRRKRGEELANQASTLSASFLLVWVMANDESADVITKPRELTISKMTRY